MGDLLKTNFCRLCLNISAQVVALENDNLLSTALGSILPGMKLDIVQAPKICSSCVEKLELAVSFKKMVLLSKHKIESNTCVENIADLCRFCLIQKHDTTLLFYDNNSNSSELVKSMIEAATAQSNLNNEKPLMCTHCWSVVKDIYSFKNHCLNTEIKLQNLYKHNHNSLSSLTKEQVFNMILEVTKHIDVSVDQEIISTINSKDHCKTDENEVNSANHVESMIVIDYLKNEASQEIATGTCDILIQKEESDSESEIFEDMLNDHDVVEIRIKKPKRKNTPLCLVPSVVDDNSETKRIRQCSVLLNRIKQEIMEEEISIEEHPVECKPLPSNLEYCEVILDTSYRRKRPAASVAPKKPFTIKHEPPERPVYTNAPQPKRKGFEKSLRIDLIDCVLYKNSTWRYIECGECDFVTPSKEIMSGHMKKHVMYSKTGFKCPNCQDVYPNPEELEDHIDNCKDGSRRSRSSKSLGKRKCPKCKFTTCWLSNLKRHMLMHLNKNKSEKANQTSPVSKLAPVKLVSPDVKNISLKEPKASKNSMSELARVKPKLPDASEPKTSKNTDCLLLYQCPHCNYKPTNLTSYKHHCKYVHNRQYICDICQKAFKLNGQLTQHMMIHCTERKFTCKTCQNTFKTIMTLKKHQLTHNRVICHVCYKPCSNLYYHRKSHQAEKFICDICQRGFKRKEHLLKHRWTHNVEKNFVCDVCQNRYKSIITLKNHLKLHMDEKNYVCKICQKRFKAGNALYNHAQTHQTEKKFVCDICQKGFTCRANLHSHETRHRLGKNFHCDFCQKGFKLNSNRRKHQRLCGTVALRHRSKKNKKGYKATAL